MSTPGPRFIVYGVGAVGGTIAAALALAGREVVGIARGPQLDAIRDRGLLLRTPDGSRLARFPCHAEPAGIGFRADDIVILTMKSQDTLGALLSLRAAGVDRQPVVCAQNGVANERLALRFFPNVYGATVMMPSDYIVPGEVAAFGAPRHGILEVGCYPAGCDEVCDTLCTALDEAGFAAFPEAAVMEGKYGKLLLNLRNIIEAAIGGGPGGSGFAARVRKEAEAAYRAAGIAFRDVGSSDPRRDQLMQLRDIAGVTRTGGSSTQSLYRGTGSIETDYLNGEIVLLGRLHDVPVPCNAWLCALARRMVAEGLKPGSISVAELERGFAGA